MAKYATIEEVIHCNKCPQYEFTKDHLLSSVHEFQWCIDTQYHCPNCNEALFIERQEFEVVNL